MQSDRYFTRHHDFETEPLRKVSRLVTDARAATTGLGRTSAEEGGLGRRRHGIPMQQDTSDPHDDTMLQFFPGRGHGRLAQRSNRSRLVNDATVAPRDWAIMTHSAHESNKSAVAINL